MVIGIRFKAWLVRLVFGVTEVEEVCVSISLLIVDGHNLDWDPPPATPTNGKTHKTNNK